MLSKLPLVLSTALFALSGPAASAAAPSKPPVEARTGAKPSPRAEQAHQRHDLCTSLSCTDAQRKTIDGVLAKMHEQMKALQGIARRVGQGARRRDA